MRLVDSSQPTNNRLTVCNQWTYQAGAVEKRFDVVSRTFWLGIAMGAILSLTATVALLQARPTRA